MEYRQWSGVHWDGGINWLLQRPSVSTVIIGARTEDQLRQNLGATGWAYSYWHQRGFVDRTPPPV